MYERVVGRGKEGKRGRNVLNEGMRPPKKIYGEKFREEFLAIRLLYSLPPLPTPSVRNVKCVAETYLRIVIDGELWRNIIFYYVWNCKNAFLAYIYILFSLNM